jgi:hypothetical protein
MPSTLADQLSNLPLTSTVLRSDFDLVESKAAFSDGVSVLTQWAGRKLRQFGIRPNWDVSGSIRLAGVSLEYAKNDESFAMYLSHPDTTLEGRVWTTEVGILNRNGIYRTSTRLSLRQSRDSEQPLPRAPGFLSDLVSRVGANDSKILEGVEYGISPSNFTDFEALLFSSHRHLPLLSISKDPASGEPMVDAGRLASLLSGVAHVVTMDLEASWATTNKYGKERSVFQGAVRCYAPGFSVDDLPYKHKLWLREAIQRRDALEKDGFLNHCLSFVFATATAQFEPFQLLTPASIRRKIEENHQPALVNVAETAISRPAEEQSSISVVDRETEGEFSPSDGATYAQIEAVRPVFIELLIEGDGYDLKLSRDIEAAEDADTFEMPIRDLKRILKSHESAIGKFKDTQEDVLRLESELRAARDETAQKNQEVMRLRPLEEELAQARDEISLLRGDYEAKDSTALKDFWDGFNLFFQSAQTLTSEARRVKAQEATISAQEESIGELKTKLYFLERRIESIQGGQVEIATMALPPPSTWSDWLAQVESNLDHLVVSTEIADRLASCPFQSSLSERVTELLEILNSLATETEDDSSLTAKGLEIQQENFVGKNASFSDESETNKRQFKSDLTFRDPEDSTRKLFCPWHGKISQEQFRIHFEWPRPKGQREIKVVYIGPKITKH